LHRTSLDWFRSRRKPDWAFAANLPEFLILDHCRLYNAAIPYQTLWTAAARAREAGHGITQATIGRELFLRESAETAREIHGPIAYAALLAEELTR
jgi:hypothetical protein